MNLEGRLTRLRALESGDAEAMYAWENDTAVWPVSGTLAPFSRHQIEQFIAEQSFDIFQTRQQRLIIETLAGDSVGAVDLFEVDPLHRRAGIGILIYGAANRRCGYASDALATLCRYAREVLGLHQLWCNVGAENEASRRLFLRAGFTEIGRKRDWQWQFDGWHDELMMQRILSAPSQPANQ